MPRPGPRRALVNVRLSEAGIDAIEAAAKERGVSKSDQIRLMLAYAQLNMPRNWQPPK